MSGRCKYTEEELLAELRRVALRLGKKTLPRRDFSKITKISTFPYVRIWGSWSKALEVAGLCPAKRGCNIRNLGFEREGVQLGTRLAVLERDFYKCVLCGASPANDRSVKLRLDHIKPVALGGKSTYWNLRVLCSKCNGSKGAKYEPDIYWPAAHYLATRLFEMELENVNYPGRVQNSK